MAETGEDFGWSLAGGDWTSTVDGHLAAGCDKGNAGQVQNLENSVRTREIACSGRKRDRTSLIRSSATSTDRMGTKIGHLTHRELTDWDLLSSCSPAGEHTS